MYIIWFMFCHQISVCSHRIRIANKFHNNVANFKCLGMTVSNKNDLLQQL